MLKQALRRACRAGRAEAEALAAGVTLVLMGMPASRVGRDGGADGSRSICTQRGRAACAPPASEPLWVRCCHVRVRCHGHATFMTHGVTSDHKALRKPGAVSFLQVTLSQLLQRRRCHESCMDSWRRRCLLCARSPSRWRPA